MIFNEIAGRFGNLLTSDAKTDRCYEKHFKNIKLFTPNFMATLQEHACKNNSH